MRDHGGGTRFLGIQWQLTAWFAAVGLAAALLAWGLLAAGLQPALAAWVGAAAGSALAAAAVAAAGMLLGVVPGLVLARGLKRRLRELGRFAAALAVGNLAHRLPADAPDEIGQLEQQLNDMADRLADAMAALREMAERNRDLAYESGALAERTRVARDLHDTVNQELFSLSLLAASVRRRLARDPQAEILADLAEVEALAGRSHATVRELILQLRPPNLEQQGLASALGEYAAAFASRHGVACQCTLAAPRLPPAVEEGLFRMAQEALNNVARHAAAANVAVTLTVSGGEAVLSVRDDGRGFEPTGPVRPTAMGLTGLRERAAALGGRLRIHSAPGQGTAVTVAVPVPVALPVAAGGGAPVDAPAAVAVSGEAVDAPAAVAGAPVEAPAAGGPGAAEREADGDAGAGADR